jgi:hypothetical protein
MKLTHEEKVTMAITEAGFEKLIMMGELQWLKDNDFSQRLADNGFQHVLSNEWLLEHGYRNDILKSGFFKWLAENGEEHWLVECGYEMQLLKMGFSDWLDVEMYANIFMAPFGHKLWLVEHGYISQLVKHGHRQWLLDNGFKNLGKDFNL